jgi:hypothetical protein
VTLNISFMIITLSWREMRHDLKDTHRVVQELAAKVFRILFAFAVCKALFAQNLYPC